MLWLIGQISIFLLIAAVIGFIIGWLLRAVWPSSRARVREGELQAALDRAGSRITDLEAGLRAKRLAANAAAEQEQAALTRLEACEAELADQRARGGADTGEVGRLRSELDGATRSMDALHRELAEIKAEAEAEASLRAVASEPADENGREDEPVTASDSADIVPAQGGLFLVQDGADLAEDPTESPVSEVLTERDDDDAYLETQRLAAVAKVTERFQFAEDVMPDDLKRIHGIGPALERLLRAMNITTFQQIADFSDDDIELVSTALGRAFPGRIRRDDWMGGARALLDEDRSGD